MRTWLIFYLVFGWACLGHAQTSTLSSVADVAGTRTTGAGCTNLSAVGQPGGISVSSGGGYVNRAGFLNTFILRPGLDMDADGLADELDVDNDGDGLADGQEIIGDQFSPITATEVNLADTDADGVSDGDEAVAGTDPGDVNALLEIVDIENSPAGREVAWVARGGNQRTYVVRAGPEAGQSATVVVFSNTVAGGAAPWFATTAAVAHASISNIQIYAVEVLP